MKYPTYTFDTAQEAFRTAPSKRTRRVYLAVAQEYFDDEMIGPDTFREAQREIATLAVGERR